MGKTSVRQTDPFYISDCPCLYYMMMPYSYLPQGQCGRTECNHWSRCCSGNRDILPWSGGAAGPWSWAGHRPWMSHSPPCRSCIGSGEKQSQSSRCRTQKSGPGSLSPQRRWSREKDTICVCVRSFAERERSKLGRSYRLNTEFYTVYAEFSVPHKLLHSSVPCFTFPLMVTRFDLLFFSLARCLLCIMWHQKNLLQLYEITESAHQHGSLHCTTHQTVSTAVTEI